MEADVTNYIYGMWIAAGVIWVFTSLDSKKAARAQSAASRILHLVLIVPAFMLLFRPWTAIGVLGVRVIPASTAAAWGGTAMTAAGLGLAVLARLWLGGNWSATVTIKEQHTLVRSGPYAAMRHPIYSGMLLAMLGTAMVFGQARCFVGAALGFIAMWQKITIEEQFLTARFGAEYRHYRTAVKALIPFIL